MRSAALRGPLRRVLAPALSLMDPRRSQPTPSPSLQEDGTRHPELPWDLRTLIVVFPPGAPWRVLNLNIVCGLTGTAFDRHWDGAARDAFDLQFCLESGTEAVTFKRFFSVAEDLVSTPGEVALSLGERLTFEGQWPSYAIHYRQPEDELDLQIRFESRPDLRWWARAPGGAYSHYTSFGHCDLSWTWKGAQGEVSSTGLHDHGFGRTLLPLRLPAAVFRYEVLRLGERDTAISLWTESGGLDVRSVGHLRRDGGNHALSYGCEVLEWTAHEDHRGRPRRVPRRWLGHQEGPDGSFHYEAQRTTEPRPVISDGFNHSFEFEGQGKGVFPARIEGPGYVEQFGSAFHAPAAGPRSDR
jgi:hypothetical protein